MILSLVLFLSWGQADVRQGPPVLKTAYVTGDAAAILLQAFPAEELSDSKLNRVFRNYTSPDKKVRILCSDRTEMVKDYPNCTLQELGPESSKNKKPVKPLSPESANGKKPRSGY